MPSLTKLIDFCNKRLSIDTINDFPGSLNGLQVENDGRVSKVGAAVDAGLIPFQMASKKGIDFLIVHHGLFWTPPTPFTGVNYEKIKHCIDHNLAVYASHLPLDCHQEIGNNAILASKLELSPQGTFLNYEGNDIGLLTKYTETRDDLMASLQNIFPNGIIRMEFGPERPKQVAILTGSGQSAFNEIDRHEVDTFITGELKQNHFNLAQEMNLNVYTCGHYETETFGVKALAQEVAETFCIPFEFVDTQCPL
jgi:dinuclear metal center YbgI/SA1388 family protein